MNQEHEALGTSDRYKVPYTPYLMENPRAKNGLWLNPVGYPQDGFHFHNPKSPQLSAPPDYTGYTRYS